MWIIAVQPRNPINPPPIGPVRAPLFLLQPRRVLCCFRGYSCNDCPPAGAPAHTHTPMYFSHQITVHFFRSLLCYNTCIIFLGGPGRTRDAVNTHLFSHPRPASQFPFVSCLAPASSRRYCYRFKSAPPPHPPLITMALLPLCCLIGVDVQDVRRMFYGLLRNHSPAQVTQCSAARGGGRR